MHTLVLFAPFDFGFEIDLRPLLGAADGESPNRLPDTLGALLKELEKVAPAARWQAGATGRPDGDGQLMGYGGEFYRAPSKRPPFLCSAEIVVPDDNWRKIVQAAGDHHLELESLQFVFQDYGIGVAELTLFLTPEAAALAPRAFAQSISELCDRLPALTTPFGADLAKSLADSIKKVGLAFADDSTSLVHRGCRGKAPDEVTLHYLWTHSLVIVDNRAAALGDVGTQDWREAMAAKGVFPKGNRFFCDVLSYQCVTPAAFVTRELEAAAVFGWGNSLVILAPGDSRASYETLIPIHYVMRILQSLSAGLFILNSDLLNEVLGEANDKPALQRGEYHRRHEAVDNLRFRADLYLSLMDEQRYNQSAHERVLWDAAVGSWDMHSQVASTQRNIALLYKLYTSRRARIDDHVRQKVTAGVTVITVASAAGVGFSIINTLLAGPDWSRLMYQIVVLLALLGFALFLFLPPKK